MEVKYRKVGSDDIGMIDVYDVGIWRSNIFSYMILNTAKDLRMFVSDEVIDYGYGWKRLTTENIEYHVRQISNLIAMEKL